MFIVKNFIFLFFIYANIISAQTLSAAMQEKGDTVANNISDILVKDMEGKDVLLSKYKGKVLMIVNVASKCGYTSQYEGLQKLYEKYNSKGLEILGFPCNDFGQQEPGTNEEIKDFCSMNFGVTFKLFDKIKVLGNDKSSLYKKLTDNQVTGTADIMWNFEKFIIDRDGDIIARFPSKVKPMSDEMIKVVERVLAE